MAISLKEVYEVCYESRHKWSNMLLALDVSNPTIESIRMKFNGNPDDCFRMGLSDWLSSGTERTWEHVVAALLSPTVNCKDIADQVAKKYLDEVPCTKEWTTDAGPTSEKLQRVNDNLIIFTSEHVGNGAFGAVFKGQYRNSPCAVKVMHHVAVQMQTKLPTGQGNKSTTQSFEREYNFLTTCVHPNVVKVLSTEKCSLWENIILVMELMDCNLKHYLSGLGEMPLADEIEVSLCKNVASGLAFIHSKQIIHRDLCGDNILLKLHSMPIAKISDFGMSKLIDPTKLSSTLSSLTHRNGYLPPEAIQSDERTYDQSLDIFSFGVIMVQIVCKAETIQSAKQRQMYFEKIPRIHRLKSLIVSCLQDCKRPNATSICVSLENELHYAGQINQTIKLAEREHSMTINDQTTAILKTSDNLEVSNISFSCCMEYNNYSLSEQTCWAIASLKAPVYIPESRSSIDLVVVLDRSASMAGRKMNMVKGTLLFIIDQLKPCDRMSLVTFGSDVFLNLPLMNMTKANKEKVESCLENIRENSRTNLCGGLLEGMKQITTSQEQKSQVRSVLLLTDGLANKGVKITADIVDEIKKLQEENFPSESISFLSTIQEITSRRESKALNSPQEQPLEEATATSLPSTKSISTLASRAYVKYDVTEELDDPLHTKSSLKMFDATIYTFGFGSDHDASLLENIATQGGGAYYFVESDKKIPEVFADCLGGLLSVMGQNITLKLELQGDNSAAEVHANRTINWTSPKKICEIGIGDLQSEEERDIVLQLKLPLLPCPQQDLVLKASLSYYNVITNNFEHDAVCLYIHRNNDEQGLLNKDVDVHRNRIITTKALKKAKSQADTNNLDDAHETLKAAMEQLNGSTSAQHTLCKEMETDLQRCRKGSDSPVAYRHYGKHLISNRTQAHCSQRSNSDGISPYRTRYKSDMVDTSVLSPRLRCSGDGC